MNPRPTFKLRCLALALLVAGLPSLHAAVKLPAVFSDDAVLQQGMPLPVWGWADPGEDVTVSFAGQTQRAKAGADGRWHVTLAPLAAAKEPKLLEAKAASGTAAAQRVRVGEVWLASGQSNMEWTVAGCRKEDVDSATAGPVPLVSLMLVPKKIAATPQPDVEAKWTACTPDTARGFSAVAFFFAREIATKLDTPVGIIASSWGGSRIEPWTPEEAFGEVPALAGEFRNRQPRTPGSPEFRDRMLQHIAATRAWTDEAEKAMRAGDVPSTQPAAPPGLNLGSGGESGTWQAMISPLAPFALRGFLWYQGESNLGENLHYRHRMDALIRGWRKAFQRADAPFLFVQLAPFEYGGAPADALPKFWVAQTKVLEIPHTGMAVINDIGNPKDIHPNNKSEVGRRLSLWALRDTYRKTDLPASGPVFDKARFDAGTATVSFRHAEGLTTRDGQTPTGFEIAGDDGTFHPAEAKIAGASVVLRSPQVPEPKQARFAWSNISAPNLANAAGLPANAFHTHWPDDPDLGPNVALGKPFATDDPNQWGWNRGLTDGNSSDTPECSFATGVREQFPKHVTIDLGQAASLRAVRVCAPAYGATKSFAVQLGEQDDQLAEIGRHDFAPKTSQAKIFRFPPRPARFVRVVFLGNHPQQDNYSAAFCFLTEVEAFAAKP